MSPLRPPNNSLTQKDWAQNTGSFFKASLLLCVCVPGQVSTSGVAEEHEAPDAGGAADDETQAQHGAVLHPTAQPAHEEEAQDDLHPAQAVHQAVAQLAEAEVALRQRSYHGLGGGGWKTMFRQSDKGIYLRGGCF